MGPPYAQACATLQIDPWNPVLAGGRGNPLNAWQVEEEEDAPEEVLHTLKSYRPECFGAVLLYWTKPTASARETRFLADNVRTLSATIAYNKAVDLSGSLNQARAITYNKRLGLPDLQYASNAGLTGTSGTMDTVLNLTQAQVVVKMEPLS
ncbi:MAG: hypothetical protein LQ344_001820 [Seirophora lacunosa]|nr:MAG: hypothetical protein LQ344_001820 [Seirophora lacunosa]